MSGLNPVDVIEEDAADLLFPKGLLPFIDEIHNFLPKQRAKINQILDFTEISDRIADPFESSVCDKCKLVLREPFVSCVQCSELFCLSCFSSGSETKRHRSDHRYSISRDDFPLFPTSLWTAREEKEFLNSMQIQGVGNWEDISAKMKKSADECRSHFNTFYFDGIFSKLGMTNENSYTRHTVPYLFKTNSLDPPRGDCENPTTKSIAGYRFARSEFDIPIDHSAESILNNISIDGQFNDDDVMDEISCAMLRAYNHRLKERNRRYKVVKNQGLIMQRKTLAWLSRYSGVFSQSRMSRFVAFMQISDPFSFDFLLESMKLFADKKKELLR